jgi:hypothetical protein
MMELVTEADVNGLQRELAAAYSASPLKQRNDEELDALMAGPKAGYEGGGAKAWGRAPSLKDLDGKGGGGGAGAGEMAVTQATATPWWWGIKTLMQVGRDGERGRTMLYESWWAGGAGTAVAV